MTNEPRFPPNPAPRLIDILTFEGGQLLDVAGPLQVFASCNSLLRRSGGADAYQTRVLAKDAGVVTTSSGLSLVATILPAFDPGPDTLIVAGGNGVDRAAVDGELVVWLRQHAAGARRVASVCTGAFLLAATGLLNGRRVATHWEHCDRLVAAHPAITVERDPIFVVDGRYWTSAGVTAGIDLALAMVEADLGREVAALRLVRDNRWAAALSCVAVHQHDRHLLDAWWHLHGPVVPGGVDDGPHPVLEHQGHRLALTEGPGNFHLKPNGVFWQDDAGALRIDTSERYVALNAHPRFATQSGPMLVIDGALHPRFAADGASHYIRNGVGVLDEHTAYFVISDDAVSFGRFARFFRDGLHCRNALFLDGSVSSLWAPNLQRRDDNHLLGPMIVVLNLPAQH